MKILNTATLQGLTEKIKTKRHLAVYAAVTVLCLAALAFAPSKPVKADVRTTGNNWSVEFTNDKKMVSNFKTNDLKEVVYGMQPGDSAKLTMKLTNKNSATTDWYMTNKVIDSLEDSTSYEGTKGGAYTYKLTYTNPEGEEKVLFDSEAVGGDDVSPAGEGLKEATDALKDYFFLDQFEKGEGGQIDLTVGLDGETQGNDYQDTLADLQMNFAVELSSSATTATNNSTTQTRRSTTRTTVVKTGDENNMLPYFLIAGAGGLFLLFFAIFCIMGRRKDKKGGTAS